MCTRRPRIRWLRFEAEVVNTSMGSPSAVPNSQFNLIASQVSRAHGRRKSLVPFVLLRSRPPTRAPLFEGCNTDRQWKFASFIDSVRGFHDAFLHKLGVSKSRVEELESSSVRKVCHLWQQCRSPTPMYSNSLQDTCNNIWSCRIERRARFQACREQTSRSFRALRTAVCLRELLASPSAWSKKKNH